GGVVKNGTGTQILSGSNTYSGGTTINGGILQVGSGGTTGTPGPGTITINNNASLVFNRTNDVVQGTDFSLIDGTGTVTQAGTGAVTLSFGNTYSGGTAITSGTLLLGNDTGAGSGTIALADGTTLGASANNLTVANPINVTGTASLGQNANNVLTLTGALTGSGTLQNKTASGSTPNLFLKGDLSGFIGTLAITNGNTNTTAFWRFGATGGATIDLSHATVNLISGPSANVSPGFIDATTVANTMKIGTLTGGGTFQGSFNGTANVFNILEVGNLNTNSTFSGVLGRSSNNMMQLSLTKVGTGTLTLSGTNIYTGDTTVNAGVLAVSGNAIANANKLVINGGKVDPMGATEVVGTLYFGATQQATGTWGATGSTATHIDDVHFTGTGVVSVTTGPPAGYSAWADLYASGQTMDQDHDNDGVKNGVEYFMGQTGSTFTANPAPVNGAVTWPMGATYTGVYGTDYEVQTSTDLVNWTQVPIGTGDNTVAVTAGTSVVYDMPAGGKSFVRLVVKN
ncbi:MAG: autotransporter-associated beta strand repeat-containing protein, partial [Chthoniobacterales bacterium]